MGILATLVTSTETCIIRSSLIPTPIQKMACANGYESSVYHFGDMISIICNVIVIITTVMILGVI